MLQKGVNKFLAKEAQIKHKIEDMDSFTFELAEEVRDADCKKIANLLLHQHLTSLPLSFDPKVGISNFIISSSLWYSHLILSFSIWCIALFLFLRNKVFSFQNCLVAARISFSPLLRSFFISFLCIISTLELILEASCRSLCRLSFEEFLSTIMLSSSSLFKKVGHMH